MPGWQAGMSMPQFYTELGWWCLLTGRHLRPFETKALHTMFLTCLSVANEKTPA